MVGIKLLFRQPQRQVHIFHRSARGSEQICISAPHSSLAIRLAVCLHVTYSDVILSRSAIKVKVNLGLAKVKP